MVREENIVKRAWRRVWGDYKRGGLRGAYHWVRCHVWDRYHVISVSGEDGYDWGWIDRDHVMLMACFKILREFVDKEDPRIGLRSIDDYCSEHTSDEERLALETGQLAREREIRALYDWWVTGRKQEHDEVDALVANESIEPVFGEPDVRGYATLDFAYGPGGRQKWEEYTRRSHELDEKDDAMLLRLMAVRGSLWT